MNITLLPPGHPSWHREVDALGVQLGAPDNPTLFPYHYLSVVLQRIGGQIALVAQDGIRLGAGFLFPRYRQRDGEVTGDAYTLRYHSHFERTGIDLKLLAAMVTTALGGSEVVPYDPTAPQEYAPTYVTYGDLAIGRPDPLEAGKVRALQQQIWGAAPEFLYPTDMHSVDFGLATSLIARAEGEPAGFLYGMYKFGGPGLPPDWRRRYNGDVRIESQSMGVLPDHRGRRIGYLLKRAQGQQAQDEGIGVIHWTVDPLQFPNAMLNFGLLRAVAFNFYPDLYPFRNQLNLVHASRFAVTWLVGSMRVRESPLYGTRAHIHDLSRRPEIERVNRGWTDVNYTVQSGMIAIEIPADWTQLQRESTGEAQRWREVTDDIFANYIGRQSGKYVVTGVGREDERRFLIGERADETLWRALGR